ncbi:uncharacterized protein LOC142616569 [Castanea sativa]|uniref:uncharacterized protein LOC142616569 n=1 Tax=Castanea sativa TaxID=21020 RepID=UPI003F6522DF
MGRDPSRRNQSLYCHYHQEKGHTTEDCRALQDNLSLLVKAGKLSQLLHQPTGQIKHLRAGYQRDVAPWLALGTINAIFTKPMGNAGTCSGDMLVVVGLDLDDGSQALKKAKVVATRTLGFSEEDKKGTFQLHDNALVVSIRIDGYDVKRVLVDQGSGAEIMYLDLYKGLNLRPEDLEKYDLPLVGFDRRMVVPRGMIRLHVQARDEEVQVSFIVLAAYSLLHNYSGQTMAS